MPCTFWIKFVIKLIYNSGDITMAILIQLPQNSKIKKEL